MGVKILSFLSILAVANYVQAGALNTSAGVLEQQIEKILGGSGKISQFGAFGNKVYFSEETEMNWYEARDFCAKYGLPSVSVDSPAEHEYLKLAVESPLRFWTSGYANEQFTWGPAGQPVTIPFVDSHHTCLILTDTGLWTDPCDAVLGFTYYPMCQLTASVV